MFHMDGGARDGGHREMRGSRAGMAPVRFRTGCSAGPTIERGMQAVRVMPR